MEFEQIAVFALKTVFSSFGLYILASVFELMRASRSAILVASVFAAAEPFSLLPSAASRYSRVGSQFSLPAPIILALLFAAVTAVARFAAPATRRF